MDKRLRCLVDMIRPGVGVVDVGTDHGYLPVCLALEGYPGRIFASDIRPGPLSAARRSAEQAGVSGRIHFLLCDGLDACPPEEIDTIVIAGMGGDAICGILDRAEWCMDARVRLILQPMTKAEVLRYWLCCNGFRIKQEALAEDGGTIYQALSAVFCDKNEALSDAELFLGKRGPKDGELYLKLLKKEIGRVERRLSGLQSSADPGKERQLAVLQRYLEELSDLRKTNDDKGK